MDVYVVIWATTTVAWILRGLFCSCPHNLTSTPQDRIADGKYITKVMEAN
jgi:hypothetical protein